MPKYIKRKTIIFLESFFLESSKKTVLGATNKQIFQIATLMKRLGLKLEDFNIDSSNNNVVLTGKSARNIIENLESIYDVMLKTKDFFTTDLEYEKNNQRFKQNEKNRIRTQ